MRVLHPSCSFICLPIELSIFWIEEITYDDTMLPCPVWSGLVLECLCFILFAIELNLTLEFEFLQKKKNIQLLCLFSSCIIILIFFYSILFLFILLSFKKKSFVMSLAFELIRKSQLKEDEVKRISRLFFWIWLHLF